MLRSMTGFGDAAAQVDGVHYFLEVRTLNNKYFKATIRLPEDLQGLEAALEAALRKRITRGSITLKGACTNASEDAAHVINHKALSRYIEQLQQAAPIASGAASFDAAALLSLPGVLQPPANEHERIEHAKGAFLSLLDQACNAMLGMRRREGEALTEDLRSHRVWIGERLDRIRERAPIVVNEYHQRLRTRVETMLKEVGMTVEPADLLREVAVFAERSDIAEEIARLTGHMEQYDQLLDNPDEAAVGRTIDFLAQEMLREANTIASKCNDASISREIVEIKAGIDRIKEQAQNAE